MMQKVEGFNTETEACGGRAKNAVPAGRPMMHKSKAFSIETEAWGGRAKVNGRGPTNDAESERF